MRESRSQPPDEPRAARVAGVPDDGESWSSPDRDSNPAPPSRRAFLRRIGGIAAAGVAAGPLDLPGLLGQGGAAAEAAEVGPWKGQERRRHAYQVRHSAALAQKKLPHPAHPTNGDEERFPDQIGSFSKGLPHDELGHVDRGAYDALIHALSTGRPEHFEKIPLGCPRMSRQRKLVNPQAALAFDLQGADTHRLVLSVPPAFSSAQEAAEMVELYWMAAARDVPFTNYAVHPVCQMAAADLSRLADFRGPKQAGEVTPATLFRGQVWGDLTGPYLSQFLLLPVPFGPQRIDQQIRTVQPAADHLTRYADWLDAQRGCPLQAGDRYDPTFRYLRNGRDLARYVQIDVLFQAYFNACLILLTPRNPTGPLGGGIGAPLDPANPYARSRTQQGFGTFGDPHVTALMGEVATRALKAVWCQKWSVHRRLRPEAFGGRIHNHATGAASYPIHADVMTSPVLDDVLARNGTFLLPQAYPEGSPLHPAYGAGHATVAGACVTILKAWFDESFPILTSFVPSPDGSSLVGYEGPGADELTVGGELNKLASNIALGRSFAGIHWRSDYSESLKLGEEVAIELLRDQKEIYSERFQGFTLARFDGTVMQV